MLFERELKKKRNSNSFESKSIKNKQIKTIESDLIRPTLSKIRESLFKLN